MRESRAFGGNLNTKLLMSSAAVALGLAGFATSFAPVELLQALGADGKQPLPVIVQLLGALYFGFAFNNWFARGNRIGGIYSRPLGLANFAHFFIGSFALLQAVRILGAYEPLTLVLVVYALFALAFGWLVFMHDPLAADDEELAPTDG